MFKATKEYRFIKSFCEPIANEKLHFSCISDGIVTFNLENEFGNSFEFSFITDDIILHDFTVCDLLDLKGITYFDFILRDCNNQTILSSMWSLQSEEMLN